MKFESNIMNLNICNAVGFLTFKKLENLPFIKHAFSTRIGGVSKNEFKSLNLGFKGSDNADNVIENYKIICDAVGFEFNSIVKVKQVHGSKVLSVNKDNILNDLSNIDNLYEADGIITGEPGITLVTSHADCLPVYLISLENKAIGLLHSGWRGTVKRISQIAVEKMVSEFGCNKEKIICAVGPSINSCCFEVDLDAFNRFKNLNDLDYKLFIKEKPNGKFNINLSEITRQMLIQSGINNENIILSDICTSCYRDLLFSYRASQGKTGTMIAMMSMNV